MTHRTAKLDRIAVRLSGLCLAHCLLLPLLMACLPVLGLAEGWHDRFHQLMLVMVLPLAAVALGRGLRRHRRREIGALGILGAGLLTIAALAVHPLAHAGYVGSAETTERVLTVGGALLLALAHAWNARALPRPVRAIT